LLLEIGDAQPTHPQTEPGKKKYKWAVGGVDDAHKADLKNAKPVPNLFKLDLDGGLKGAQRSESGSEGVFFVTLNSGGIFVLKASKSISEEVFSNLIAQALGVYSPKLRIIYSRDQEGDRLLDLIIASDKQGVAIHGILSAEYFLLKEFLPGTKNFDKCTAAEIKEFFYEEFPHTLSVHGKKYLHNLGVILAVDVITNYSDRLPLIWDNPGNSGNLMITNKGQFVSVENGITTFATNSATYEQYSKRVKTFLDSLINNPETVLPEFQKIDDKFMEFAGISIGDVGILAVQEGFIEFIRNTPKLELSKAQLENWKSVLEKFQPPLVGVSTINVDCIANLLDIFRESAKKLKNY